MYFFCCFTLAKYFSSLVKGLVFCVGLKMEDEMSVVPEPGVLTALPNEVLVRIFSYLDLSSLLSVHASCSRFRLVTSDPVCWPTSISWKSSSHIKDVDKLKLVLRLSKDVLKHITLSCISSRYPLSKCVDRIQACHHLESVSVHSISCTRAQVEKLLRLPSLRYLHLDQLLGELRDSARCLAVVAQSGCKLKTLSLKASHSFVPYAEAWAKLQYVPPDLRIAMVSPEISKYDIQSVFGLCPSVEHDAWLSLYGLALENFAPVHPHLQFYFTPNPSLPLVHANQGSLPLLLTADQPGSKEFSCAVFKRCCQDMKGNFDFLDVSSGLTAMHLVDSNVLPSTLESIARSCPNLRHLDLSCCIIALSDFGWVSAVANCCPKLRVLNLYRRDEAMVGDLEKLWGALQSMSNLRVLYIPILLIHERSDPISMPHLTNLHIVGHRGDHHIERVFNFLTQMLSLEVFKCDYLPPVSLCYGVSKFLHSSLNLTHFYLKKDPGNKLTLPADPSCYRHLQKFFLECSDFVVHEDLASALAQSGDLSVLVFRVASVATKGIVELANSLKLLSLFYIHVLSFEGRDRSHARANAFAKSLREIIKKKGRTIDLKINVGHGSIDYPELFYWFPS